MNNFNNMVNTDSGVNGVYRAKLIEDDGDIRAFIPGINNISPFKSDGTLDLNIYESNKQSFPKVQWCCYNVESKEFSNQDPLTWVMFENGDFRRPVVLSYAVIGGGITNTNTTTLFDDMDLSQYAPDNAIDDKTTYIFEKLRQMGASVGGASAIIGAMWGESARTMSPYATNDLGTVGIGQWLYARKTTLINGGYVGSQYWNKPVNAYDIDTQIEYYVFELKYLGRPGSPTWDDLCKNINTEQEVRGLVFSIIRYFETPFLWDSPDALKANNPDTYNNYYIPCVTKAVTYFNEYKD